MNDIEALIARLDNLAARIDGPDGTMVVTASDIRACLDHIRALSGAVEAAEAREAQAWSERNVAYAKVKGWESVVYVEKLPLRAVEVTEWGPGEGGTTTVPSITPQKLTDLLDELKRLRSMQEDRS